MKPTSATDVVASAALPRAQALLYLVFAAAILRLLSLGLYPLMDSTEARYAEIARVMVERGDWVTPWYDAAVPFWGKPPLSFWLTAASFEVFGFSEFAARLPHWLCAVAVAWLTWGMASRQSARLAVCALAVLCGSAVFLLSAGAVMTDMAMLVGITMAMRGFWLGLHGHEADRRRERWWLFVGLGVGLLAKGPIAVVLSAAPIGLWVLLSGSIGVVWRGLPWLRGGLLTLLIAVPWYVLAEIRTPGFLEYFLVGEHWNRFLVPGWKGDLYGFAQNSRRGVIWLFLLVDMLPWALLVPAFVLLRLGGKRPGAMAAESAGGDRSRGLYLYLWLWALTPAAFFTFSGNVLWTYVLPGVPALALLIGGWLVRRGSPARVDGLLATGVATMLCALFALIATLHATGLDEERSQKALVAAYDGHRQADEALLYLGKRQYSAGFYSRGKARFVPDATALAESLPRAAAYVAIPNGQIATLPAAVAHTLQPIAVHGRYALYLHPAAPAGGR